MFTFAKLNTNPNNTNMLRFVLFLLSMLFSTALANALDYTVSFDRSKLSIENVVRNDSNFSVIRYEGLSNGGNVGHASLPVKQIRISVPYNATNIGLRAEGKLPTQITTDYPLLLNSNEVATIGDYEVIDRPVSPLGCGEIAYIGYACGSHKIVTINVYPVKTYTSPNTAQYCSSVTLKLTWTLSDDLSNEPYKSIPSPMATKGLDYVKSMVVNPEKVVSNMSPTCGPIDPQTVDEDDRCAYDFIIIAPDEFCDALRELVQIRRMKGYNACITPLSHILNNNYNYGDDTDPDNVINDDAGKLRKYVQEMYEFCGVKNILLAGKYPKMPIRYAKAPAGPKITPTDLYFSDLNTKWKLRQDNIYQAQSMQYDFISEINVGRIPFETIEEIQNYTDKLKIYEFYPGNGDASYLGKTIITRQDDSTINYYFPNDVISKIHDTYDNNVIEMFNPYGQDVVAQLNITPVGCWNFIGHGNPEGVSTNKTSLGDGGLLALDSQLKFLKRPTSMGIDKVTNQYYPSWQYSMSCTLMPFDIYTDGNGSTYDLSKNFGESYILGKNYGGVAILGNTRPHYLVDGNTCINKFFSDIKRKYLDINTTLPITAGELLSEIRTYEYLKPYLAGGLITNLFGDPLTPLFISEPHKLEYDVVIDKTKGHVYKVSVSSSDQLFLADMDLNLKHAAHLNKISEADMSSINIVPNVIKTVYGKNTLPCVLPLYLFGITLDNTTIFANVLNLNTSERYKPTGWYGVDPEEFQNNGKVVIAPGRNVKINLAGPAFIDNTLQLSENCTFELYSDVTVEIDNVYVPKGAKLIINGLYVCVGDYGITKHPEGEVVLIGRESLMYNSENSSRKYTRSGSENKKLAIKGRTWWYKSTTNMPYYECEYGIRIGEEVTINNETWNKLKICLYTNRYDVGESPEDFYKSDITFAYIKDNGHTICVYRDNAYNEESYMKEPWWHALEDYVLFADEPFQLYNFGEISERSIYGCLNSLWYSYIIKDIGEIKNSGNNYRLYTTEVHPKATGSNFPCEDGRTYEYIEGIGHPKYFMLMPYGGGCPETLSYAPPLLTYVTEGEDNHVIFEAAGGSKLWEMAGVETVFADNVEATEQWFNLQGVAIEKPTTPGLYIHRYGAKTEKVAVR